MPRLKVTYDEALAFLEQQIISGREVVESAAKILNQEDYVPWMRELTAWVDVTKATLGHVYEGDAEVKSFEDRAVYRSSHVVYSDADWSEYRDWRVGAAEDGISTLETLKETAAFAEEPFVVEPAPATTQPDSALSGPPTIFLVHGHDERRDRVARFLERACQNRYRVVILEEQPGRSGTVIERLERQSPAYAVIVLTGDDVGGVKKPAPEEPDLHPRARQNVVFEFGLFCGKIGRDHVAVLYDPGVELPSDIAGLTYINLGEADWRARLVRDLRDAGLDFSMDRV